MTALILTLLTLGLAPAVAQAGGRGPAKGESKPAASRVQERGGMLQTLWRGLTSLFEKEGGSIDPSGKPGTGTSNSVTDNGGSIDPSGTP